MDLDDLQIERYSRQIVLPEVGAEGQMRLLGARVAVVAPDPAARWTLAHLAAAGVGRLAAPAALHDAVDPAQRDVAVTAPDPAAAYDLVVTGAADAGRWRARHALWLAGPRLGGAPPCPACAAAALPAPAPVPAPLAATIAPLLGALAATEVVKLLVGAGTPLTGRVLTWDAAAATAAVRAVDPRAGCAACGRGS